MSTAHNIAKAAKTAFEQSQLIASEERITALKIIRDELKASKDEVMNANREDLAVSIHSIAGVDLLAHILVRLSVTAFGRFSLSATNITVSRRLHI